MRRFNRSQAKRGVIEKLTASDIGVFSQIWQVMIFAACLGVQIGRREPVDDPDGGVAIPPSVFANNCSSWPGLLYLINIVESEDPAILTQDDATDELRMKLVEEYANGGLSYLAERLESRNYSLDSVCQLLVEVAPQAPVTESKSETI